MIITETKLAGVYLIEPRRFEDDRGFFAPSFTAREFAARGLTSVFVENNISFSRTRGTLCGMHYQAAPHGLGFRWNDPAFGIEWHDAGEAVLNQRDQQYPDFTL